MALTDVLTGLPNRRHVLSALEREWDRITPGEPPVACLMIDADGFKPVNDTHGHGAGDLVLRELARALVHAVRTDDVVARLGGDEFLALSPRTDAEGARRIAEKVRESVASMNVPIGESGSWRGSVSVGVAARGQEMARPEDLVKEADGAVYRAKSAGRNCVRGPGPDR
jgi:hemerythrin